MSDPTTVDYRDLARELLAALQDAADTAQYWWPDKFDDAEHETNCVSSLDTWTAAIERGKAELAIVPCKWCGWEFEDDGDDNDGLCCVCQASRELRGEDD